MEEALTPLALLVNPAAAGGRAKRLLPAVEERLDELRLSFRVEVTRSGEHAVEEALAAADAGELPVVMGGDGLAGMVGGALAGGTSAMGLIPCGRGNDLARVLGIPTDPVEAIDLIASAPPVSIDVGEANGVRFLGIASCGFDSEANRIANRARILRGRSVYAYGALRALLGWRPAKFRITTPEERFTFVGYSVAVANNRAYGGGMLLAPQASLVDGELDVITIGETGKFRFLASLPKVFKGTHIDEPDVHVMRTTRVEISASREFGLYADGEHITDLPARIRVLPRALAIIAPGEAP